MKFEIIGYKPREGKRWQIGIDTAKELEKKNRFIWDGEKIKLKIYDFEDKNTLSARPNLLFEQGTDVYKRQSMNRIKDVLDQKGIKQKWLAERLGKSYNMVNSYAQNRRQPSLEDLYKIAEILDVEVKELLIERKVQ